MGLGIASAIGDDIGGALLNYGIGRKRNKSARKALEEANRVAGININQGYDTALGALDTGQQALESGYDTALGALDTGQQALESGYDTALGALDTGQQALESGYGAAKDTKERISGQMGEVAQQGFNAQSDMWTPWTVPGLNAYKNMDTLLNDPNGYNTILQKYQASPQFQFQLKQATDAVQRSAAAKGNRLGGAQLSALSGRANDVANQSFNGWLDRLQQMAQTGFNAQSNLSQAQNNLTAGRTNALQYGDTSAFDVGMGKDVLGINQQRGDIGINRGKDVLGINQQRGDIGINRGKDVLGINQQRGDIGINRGQDMANLALGRGTIGANYHLAQGKNGQDFVNALGQKSGAGDIAGLSKVAALF